MVTQHEYTNETDWLALREQMADRLGGSEIGVAANHSEYDSAYSLFCKKLGAIPERDISLNEPIVQGKDCEDVVAQRFARITGKSVYSENCIYTNDKYPHLKATPDRLIDGEDSGLECKTAQREAWRKNEPGDFPITYFDQCCCYLAVTDRTRWYLSAMVYGNAFRTFLMTRKKEEADRYAELKELFSGFVSDEEAKRYHQPLDFRKDYFTGKVAEIAELPDDNPLHGKSDEFKEWIEKWCYIEAAYYVDQETLDACEKVAANFIGRCDAVKDYMDKQTFQNANEQACALHASIAQIWPQDEIDCSEATEEALLAQYPHAEEGTAIALDGECVRMSDGTKGKTYAELLADRKRCKEQIEELEDTIATIENSLALKIGDAEKAVLDGWSIAYKNASYRSLDKEGLAAHFGGRIPDKFFKESSSRRWYIREKKAKADKKA